MGGRIVGGVVLLIAAITIGIFLLRGPTETPVAPKIPVTVVTPTPTPIPAVREPISVGEGVTAFRTRRGSGPPIPEGGTGRFDIEIISMEGEALWSGVMDLTPGIQMAFAGLDLGIDGMLSGEARELEITEELGYPRKDSEGFTAVRVNVSLLETLEVE